MKQLIQSKKMFLLLLFTVMLNINSIGFCDINIKCHGTEPFWGISISSKGIIWEDTEKSNKTVYPYKAPKTAAGMTEGNPYIFESKVTMGKNKTSYIKIFIIPAPKCQLCTDGMADKSFPYSVIVDKDGIYYTGCAK